MRLPFRPVLRFPDEARVAERREIDSSESMARHAKNRTQIFGGVVHDDARARSCMTAVVSRRKSVVRARRPIPFAWIARSC